MGVIRRLLYYRQARRFIAYYDYRQRTKPCQGLHSLWPILGGGVRLSSEELDDEPLRRLRDVGCCPAMAPKLRGIRSKRARRTKRMISMVRKASVDVEMTIWLPKSGNCSSLLSRW